MTFETYAESEARRAEEHLERAIRAWREGKRLVALHRLHKARKCAQRAVRYQGVA